jgi:hypothetical protein
MNLEQIMIKNKYNQIQKKLKSAQSELERLQGTCEHPNAEVKHKGDRGNYDPSMDRYWIEYNCPDCGKFWTEEK